MPSRHSTGRLSTYEALPAPTVQKTFPNRRRSVKQRLSLPKLPKKQSTLTQLEFACKREDIIEAKPFSSQEEDEEVRPKKRRRTTNFGKREADQSTMTQFQRGDLPSLGRSSTSFKSHGAGFQIWQDSDTESLANVVWQPWSQEKQEMPWPRGNGNRTESSVSAPEIPETSQPATVSSPRADSGVDLTACRSASKVRTPCKPCVKVEIPSSVTPSTAKSSIRKPKYQGDVQRSPLAERSRNVRALGPPPMTWTFSTESEKVTPATCEVISNDAANPCLPSALPRDALNPPQKHTRSTSVAGPRELTRTSTIQDSEGEYTSITSPRQSRLLARNITISDSVEGDAEDIIAIAEDKAKQTRKLQRTATVRDSQHEGFTLDSEDSAYALNLERDTHPAAFDPANSALDRDASRYMWTQTQALQTGVGEPIQEDDSDDDDEEDDLDRGCASRPNAKDTARFYGPSQVPEDAARQHSSPATLPVIHMAANPRGIDAASANLPHESGLNSHQSAHQQISLPSSPPAPCPSQVSTIVPTQSSPPRPKSRDTTNPTSPLPFSTLVSTPAKSYSVWLGSSSPIPLPPWSSPFGSERQAMEMLGGDGKKRNSDRDRALVDFSLPPPPPLWSSSRTAELDSSGR